MTKNDSPKNLLSVFEASVLRRQEKPCFRFKRGHAWVDLNWIEVKKQVLDLIGGLSKLGVKKGDRVAIFSKTRCEWTITDLAILGVGAITVPIYESSLPEAAEYILQNADVRVVFVDGASQLAKIKKVVANTPVKQIVLFDGEELVKEDGVYAFEEIQMLGSGFGEAIYKQSLKELTPETEASYVYTSGTTGHPKGVVLTHRNILAEMVALSSFFEILPDYEKSLLFLPLAHIFARVIQFSQIQRGFIQCYAESIDKLLDNMAEINPYLLPSVPRIFEKVHTRVIQGVADSSDTKKKIFNWSLSVGKERSELLRNKKPVPLLLSLKWQLAYKLVFSKLHAKLGGRVKYCISGGAPLSLEIAEFFHAAGFIILEAYGLTETTGGVTLNLPDDYRLGVVGKPARGVEVKIAEDGEILIKGDVVFKGYYKRPEDTAEVIKKGWFHTGDIGVFDDLGFLKITDRKKDIIVTAGGKNIAPQNIENLIKTDPYISQVMVHGDNRKFLSALITLDQAEVVKYAKSKSIPFKNYADLIKQEPVLELVKNKLEEKNKQLAKYETIKKFAILDQDFSVETGELTPTMKVKRKFTSEKFKHILDEFYTE